MVMAIPAWLVPQRAWRWLAWIMAEVTLRLHPSRFRAHRERMAPALGGEGEDQPAKDGRRVQLGLVANNYEARYFQPLRAHRPGGWRPQVRLSGREHIERALAAGNGAVLWVCPLVFYPLVTKMALAQAGFPPVHLSQPMHGFLRTRFGVRYLNPIVTKAEDAYIAERIVHTQQSTTRAMRSLIARVRENRVVTITANRRGSKVYCVPLFHGELQLASGGPSLARLRSAPRGRRRSPFLVIASTPPRRRTLAWLIGWSRLTIWRPKPKS